MEPIYMNCFICEKRIDASELNNHLIECKKIWEAKLNLSEGSILKKYDYWEEEKKKYKEYCKTIKESKKPEKIKREKGERPRTIKCPLCDIEFSIGAWKIHIKRCKEKEIEGLKYCNEKYINEIEDLVKKTFNSIECIYNKNKKIKSKGVYDVENLGNDAFDNNKISVVCFSCGRKFDNDKIEKHQKICLKHPELFKKK